MKENTAVKCMTLYATKKLIKIYRERKEERNCVVLDWNQRWKAPMVSKHVCTHRGITPASVHWRKD